MKNIDIFTLRNIVGAVLGRDLLSPNALVKPYYVFSTKVFARLV